jgi:hypothetical protein
VSLQPTAFRAEVSDYEAAAQMQNRCRSRGIAGSTIELLICLVAYRRNWLFFTTDRDFGRYERVLAVKLHRAVVGGDRRTDVRPMEQEMPSRTYCAMIKASCGAWS